ncbi:signal transduction histidine kinase [Novosphingobium hassiacum]|uniref:histidine kinase n=1 Tax=Novosphingobium hassiacum TaxID=173676 RepID=A0A7W6EVK0_9SPHN|nr:signal transduction histidine kinase [Novosphingobium hassiacum]
MLFLVAVPAFIANHALQVVHAQTARAEASAQTLSAYQRLALLGYTLLQDQYVDPQSFKENRSVYIDGVRSHVANANRYIDAEIRLISEVSLQRPKRAAKIAQEFQQREQLRSVGANLERAMRGDRNADWETTLFKIIKDEEVETRDYQRGSIETFEAVTETFKWTLAIVSICGVLAVIWTQQQIIRPLGNLQRGTRAISQGDYEERVPIVGTTEFRTIASSFNAMVSRVDDASRSLQQTNASLERAVARRTAELAATNRSLERANLLRRQFLADASHELRTPLSIMRSEAEITLRQADATPEDLRMGLDRVVRLTALMAEMIDDMLQVARAEEPMLHSTIAPIDVVEAVRSCIDDFHRVIESDGGRISLVQAPAKLMIESDETRLKQVIRIIVDNAVCYSAHAPLVDVAICEEQGSALITIEDKGYGIPAEEIPLLFQRFRRGGRRIGSGQGLGLSIARSITETLGGTISLQSKLHEGTTVSIRLPLLGPPDAPLKPNLPDTTDGTTS